MHRCLELAKTGAGFTAPNPIVGAVLVHNGKIIGEGFHRKFGEAHAEVNCLQSVKEEDRKFISQSTLYVSLEPCAHFGKTPPCTDLIIQHKILKVVIGCADPSKKVNGKGIEKLKTAGVEANLASGGMDKACKELNKRFFTFNKQHRPYIILKWAETADGKIAHPNPPPTCGEELHRQTRSERENSIDSNGKISGVSSADPSPFGGSRMGARLLITNEQTNRLVHKWRSEEAAILVGTNTALYDNPELTARLWPGPSPVRMVVDMNLRLPSSLKIFNREQRTIIFNRKKHKEDGNLFYYKLTGDTSLVRQIVNALYLMKIQSVLVEGGSRLLQSFIDEGLWDEARVISNKQLTIGNGIAAPELSRIASTGEIRVQDDVVNIYLHGKNY
jgi:diaminohydroxyphosphoribosylaminopyrimidine deaminase/5-amino-6-(5-phosphoribosylamino)uracil reductase